MGNTPITTMKHKHCVVLIWITLWLTNCCQEPQLINPLANTVKVIIEANHFDSGQKDTYVVPHALVVNRQQLWVSITLPDDAYVSFHIKALDSLKVGMYALNDTNNTGSYKAPLRGSLNKSTYPFGQGFVKITRIDFTKQPAVEGQFQFMVTDAKGINPVHVSQGEFNLPLNEAH